MEVIEEVKIDSVIQFSFPVPDRLPPPLLSITDGEFYYSPDKPLYKDINFGVDMDSRIAIVGANGAGKSTLINILLQKLSLGKFEIYKFNSFWIESFQ
jgi:ATPase subunit of ABC transporter with duplicated ATPase domains